MLKFYVNEQQFPNIIFFISPLKKPKKAMAVPNKTLKKKF